MLWRDHCFGLSRVNTRTQISMPFSQAPPPQPAYGDADFSAAYARIFPHGSQGGALGPLGNSRGRSCQKALLSYMTEFAFEAREGRTGPPPDRKKSPAAAPILRQRGGCPGFQKSGHKQRAVGGPASAWRWHS